MERFSFKNPENSISEIFNLLPHFKYQGDADIKQVPSILFETLYKHCDSALTDLFSDIQSLAKFLIVGINDRDIGITGKGNLCDIAYHLEKVAQLGASLSNIRGHAYDELKNRGIQV